MPTVTKQKLKEIQAVAILDSLSRWFAEKPGHRLVLETNERDGYTVRLEWRRPGFRVDRVEEVRGKSATDVLAQATTVLNAELAG